jgi:hypothetical protein
MAALVRSGLLSNAHARFFRFFPVFSGSFCQQIHLRSWPTSTQTPLRTFTSEFLIPLEIEAKIKRKWEGIGEDSERSASACLCKILQQK